MLSGRIITGILALIFLINSQAFCQKHKNKKRDKEKTELSADTISNTNTPLNEIFAFGNINKIPYYYNEPKLIAIHKYQDQKDWQKLYNGLADYIKNFGIQNFYKDTEMIWQLAKLTELYGNMEDAKKLYRLALKHYHDDIQLQKLEIYYDSISQKDQSKYVPIEYYYELIEYRKQVDTIQPPRGWRINMGHTINSEYSDYGPALSVDNKTLIFTSKRNIVQRGLGRVSNEDVYLSHLEYETWSQAEPLKDINTSSNEGSVCLSKDGKTMYFARCDAPDGYGNCDLYMAALQPDSTWGLIHNLGINVNSKAWDSHPSLSHNDDTLYFASDRIGGFGLSDIYFTSKNKFGEWMPAQNVGPIINTRKNEVSPFMHPKYNILYFSSNGQNLNFGEFDIYKSARKEDHWQEPQNIGPLVNGSGSEFYFTIDSESKNLYYARSIENNMDNLDLYSFPLPMEAQPLATTKLTGSLLNTATGNPFERGIVSIIDLENGIEVAPKYLSPDGTFEFNLINNNKYLLLIQGDEFFRVEQIFVLKGDMNLDMLSESITSRMEFESIEFDNASAELKTSMYRDLDRVANFLVDNPDFKLKISGHTDSEGSKEFNLELSKARAKAIADYIIYFGGISAARVETEGYGSSKPIVEEKTEADKALNRRVEFELYRPSKAELEKMHKEIKQEKEEEW